MLPEFLHHVHSRNLFAKQHRLLLALSGGVDSVVLAHLLKQGDFDFSVAHCNFNLRGTESEKDEKFCKALAEQIKVPFYSIRFDTKAYARKHKQSIQVAARQLRYHWLHEQLKIRSCDFLLTAHHADDSSETMLLNLVRGTGIEGLKGVPERNGQVLRPLLPFHKSELLSFARKEKLKFREDKSNLQSHYDRNFIRLKLIPQLAKLNPSIHKTLAANTRRFAEEGHLLNLYLQQLAAKISKQEDQLLVINREALLRFEAPNTLLHHLLYPLGFNDSQVEDLLFILRSGPNSGKQFLSATHQLSIDREALRVRAFPKEKTEQIIIHDLGELQSIAGWHVLKVKKAGKAAANELFVSLRQFIFPLVIRGPSAGDKFKPFGMTGFKLLSDFLRAQKQDRFQKEACKLLVNGNGEIIWVIGMRSDERYRVKEPHTDIIKLLLE